MTVQELIEKLQKQDPNAEVWLYAPVSRWNGWYEVGSVYLNPEDQTITVEQK